MEQSRTALPGVPIWNVYGPTETTSIAIAGMVEPGEDPPIGRPIANVEAYVLDARRRLVPAADLVFADALAVEAVKKARPRRLREFRVLTQPALGRLRDVLSVVVPRGDGRG